MGRLHGVPTPLNAALCSIGRELLASGSEPGSLTEEALRNQLGLG